MVRKFTKSILLQMISLSFIVFAFFYETLKMQPWKDDYGLLYNLQQKEPFPYPYHHLVDLHAPFFSILGTNPQGYFVLGILFVFLAAITFYYLVYELFANKMLAFMASLVFVTTPMGVDTVFMLMTFATTYFLIALFLLALIFIVKFYKNKRFLNYVVALILLALSFELAPFRSFYLIGIVFLFELIFLKRDEIKNFLLRQIGLVLLWIFIFYVNPIFLLPSSLKIEASQATNFFQGGIDYRFLLYPLLTVTNIIFSGFAFIVYQNFYIKNVAIAIILLLGTIVFFAYIFFWLKQKKVNLLRVYVFALFYLYFTPLAFYVFSQKEISTASFRYLSGGLPAYGLLIICIFVFLSKIFQKNKKLIFLPIAFFIIVILVNSITTQIYIKNFNKRSYYSKQFSAQMKELLPTLPKNALIYYQLDEDPQVNYRLYDTSRGGHYDDRAYFGVLYHLKQEEINLAYGDFVVLLEKIKNIQIDKDKIFAFKYGENGLTDITKSIKESVDKNIGNSRQ